MLASRISGTAISLIGLLLLGTSCSRNQTAQTLEFPQALGQAENVNYKEGRKLKNITWTPIDILPGMYNYECVVYIK